LSNHQKNSDLDKPLGRPKQTHSGCQSEKDKTIEPSVKSNTESDQGTREGDNMVGRPKQKGNDVKYAIEEASILPCNVETRSAKELLESLETSSRSVWVESTLLLLLVFLSTLLLFFMLKAFGEAWVVFMQLPEWVSWIFITLLGMAGAVVLFCMVWFWIHFSRLQPPGRTLSRDKLFGGKANRAASDDALGYARRYLRSDFLEEYRNNLSSTKKLLLDEWGEETQVVQKLESSIDKLLSPESYSSISHKVWLERFDVTFISLLHEVANRRCKKVAKLAGIKTAISPWGVMDMLVVLGNSVILTGDMLRLFNRKTRRGNSFRLFFHILIQTYLASEAQEHFEGVVDSLSDGIEVEAAKIVGKAAAKTAEGFLNGRLVYRLGMKAFEYVSPIGS